MQQIHESQNSYFHNQKIRKKIFQILNRNLPTFWKWHNNIIFLLLFIFNKIKNLFFFTLQPVFRMITRRVNNV